MKAAPTLMPGYRLNEYLVVIGLNEDLRNRISTIRKDFNEKFRISGFAGSKSHIALARFATWSMVEEKLIQRLQHITMGVTPFKIELKDFGSYPTHSIHINVTTKLPIQELNRELRSAQRLMKADPEREPYFITDPHIPLGRKLLPWQYEKAWQEYANLHFHARVVADSMLLLKRPSGETPYVVARRFEFMNLPVSTRQGMLFA